MRLYFLIILLLSLSSAVGIAATPARPHVVFVNPGHQSVNLTGTFWSKVSLFTEAAARDLNVKLTTFYAQRDHFYMRSLVKQALKLDPDYLILVNEKSVGPSLLKLLADSDVGVFFVLNDLSKSQNENLESKLRKRVIGGVKPNNYHAGFIQAKRLLESNLRAPGHRYQVLALLGDHSTNAALERQKGMLDAFKASSVEHELIGSLVANWSYDLGFIHVGGLLKRHQNIDLIWAANDAIAFGALKAVRAYEQSALVGGVNWDLPPESGNLYVSMGGHVALGALALVYLHDLYHGLDRPNRHWTAPIFVENDNETSRAFIELMYQNKIDDIDFSRFSANKTSKLPFTIEALVEATR